MKNNFLQSLNSFYKVKTFWGGILYWIVIVQRERTCGEREKGNDMQKTVRSAGNQTGDLLLKACGMRPNHSGIRSP